MGTWTIYTAGADVTLLAAILNGVAMICSQTALIWGFALVASLWRLFASNTAAAFSVGTGQAGGVLAKGWMGAFTPLLLAMALTSPGTKATVQVQGGGVVTAVANVPFAIAAIPVVASIMSSNVGTLVSSAFLSVNPNYDLISAGGNGFLDPLKRLLGARTAIQRLSGIDSEIKSIASACLGPDAGVDYAQINALVMNAGNTGATAAQTLAIRGADRTSIGALLYQASLNTNGVVLDMGMGTQRIFSCSDAAVQAQVDIDAALASAEFARVIQGAVNGMDQPIAGASYAIDQFSTEYTGVRQWSTVVGNLAGGQAQANAEAINFLFAEIVANNLNCLKATSSDKTACEASMIQANEIERNNIQAAANEVPMLKYAGSFGNYILALIIGLGPVIVMFMMFAGTDAGKSIKTVAHIMVWPLLVTNVGAELVNAMISMQFANFMASIAQGGFLSLATMNTVYKELSLQVGTGSHVMASLPVLMSMIFALGETAALVSVANEMKPKGTDVGENLAPAPTSAAPLVHQSSPVSATQGEGWARSESAGALNANSATMAAGEVSRQFGRSVSQARTEQRTTNEAFAVSKDWQDSVNTGNFSRFNMDSSTGYRINSVFEQAQSGSHRDGTSEGASARQADSRNASAEVNGGVGFPGSKGGGLFGISGGVSGSTGSGASDTKEHSDSGEKSDSTDRVSRLAKAFSSDTARNWVKSHGGETGKAFRDAQGALSRFETMTSASSAHTDTAQEVLNLGDKVALATQAVGPSEIAHNVRASPQFARYQSDQGRRFDNEARSQPYLERAREDMKNGVIGNVQGSMGERDAVLRMRAASSMAVDRNAPQSDRIDAATFLAGAYQSLTGFNMQPASAAELGNPKLDIAAPKNRTGVNAAALEARGAAMRARGVPGGDRQATPPERPAELNQIDAILARSAASLPKEGTVATKVDGLIEDAADSGLSKAGAPASIRTARSVASAAQEWSRPEGTRSPVRFGKPLPPPAPAVAGPAPKSLIPTLTDSTSRDLEAGQD